MHIPKKYTQFSEQYPDIFSKYNDLAKACRDSGPLDEKTRNLVKLGIAIGANSRGGVMSATRKTVASGANAAEIHQVVLMAMTTIGFPSMISSLAWVAEVLENDK